MSKFRSLYCFCVLALGLMLAALTGLAIAQTRVENVASLTVETPSGETQTIYSNRTTLDVPRKKLPTRLSFRRLPVGYQFDLNSLSCDANARIVTSGPMTPEDLVGSAPLKSLDLDNPLVIMLESQGSNRDPLVRETAYVVADTGAASVRIALLETAPDSSVFAGALPPSPDDIQSPCQITMPDLETLSIYFPEDEYSFGSRASLLIDPEGHVFDSLSGAVLNGATVTLIDAFTGQPAAHVFGDDGISDYPNTVVTGSTVTDSSGWIYKFDPGHFRFPLAPAGRYRLKVEPPAGYVAPSVVPRASLEALPGPKGGKFTIVDASFGGDFVLSTPDPVRIDIPVDRAANASLLLEKIASVREVSPGDLIQYRLRITNAAGAGPAPAPIIEDTMPPGLRYRKGSVRGAQEPQISADGRILKFPLDALAAGETRDVTYVVDVMPGAPVGEALNRARAVSAGDASNESSASVRIRPFLFSDATTIIGRVTQGDCSSPARGRKGVAGIRLMLEDGTFVITDADGLYHFEGLRAGTHVVQMDRQSIPNRFEPVACDADTRSAGSAISRFVSATGGSLQRVEFQLRPKGEAGDGDVPPLDVAIADAPVTDASVAAGNRSDWLVGQAPGIDWLFPQVDHNPRAPALRVVIKHGVGQRVALRVNGAVVDPLTFDGTQTDEPAGVAVSVWTGLPLHDGDNRLDAQVLNADGSVAATLQRTVHYANVVARAAFVAEKSRLVADGLTRPLIAVRLIDRDGKPVRDGTPIAFAVDQPYAPAADPAVKADVARGRQVQVEGVGHVAGDDGIAYLALEPTTQPGAARVTVTIEDKGSRTTTEFRPWLAASARDWMVVGFGQGTLGYEMLSSKSKSLPRADRNKLVTDGQIAFYAKGRVKGSWLLTIAYDSDRKYDPDRGLLGTIDPDRYYTVYGDATRQGYDAATRRKLYLRLERREFYALFGDFETGLTDTELTRYSRTLNGVKAEYHGKTVQFTGFGAHSDQLYGRDEIQGNGLSGPYRLSSRDIIPNSDKVRIETRDRFRSEKIIDSKSLARHIDYDIDPIAGTLRFREPILSRDPDLNPVFIVVDYEVQGGRGKKKVAGGRVSARLADGKVEIGASLLHDQADGNATVGGVDVKVRIAKNTEISAEAATGGSDGLGKAKAYVAQVEHHGKTIDATAYVRQQDAAFGLGQQNGVEAGTRKMGFDGRAKITDRISLEASAWHQENLGDPGQRMAGEARLEYRRDTGTLFAGFQFASDTGIGGTDRDSRLLTLGGTQRFFGQKLEVKGQTQFAIGGQKSSVDFPARQLLGLAYEIKPGIRLIGSHEIAEGATFKAHGTRFGVDVAPWTGARVLTTMNSERLGENGMRTFAEYGLSQSLPIGKNWIIDATVDASTTVRGHIPAEDIVNPLHPVTSGGFVDEARRDGDYRAITLGAAWRKGPWLANGRIEYSDGDRSDRRGLTLNVARSLGAGKTVAAGARYYSVKDNNGAIVATSTANVAVAWRPLDSRWALLEKFELRKDRADAGATDGNALSVPTGAGDGQTSARIVNNLSVSYRTGEEGEGHKFEASLYHGAKYVVGRFGDDRYTGYVDMIGVEIRKDLGTRFDIGVNAAVQRAWKQKATNFTVGPSIGVSPADGMWIQAGYNVRGFRDRDFEEARYTRQGPYVTMRFKFDQDLLRGAAGAIWGGRR